MTDPTPVTPATTSYVVPERLLDDDLSLLDAALALAGAGFRVLPTTAQPTASAPTKSAAKNPGGLLGKSWQSKTSTDPDTLRAWFTPIDPSAPLSVADLERRAALYREVPFESMGLAVHAGPDIVIVDIDTPENVPDRFWNELDTAPFQSSSSTDARRGHYYFQVVDGVKYGHTSSIPGVDGLGSPGEIRHGSAIAVSAPSVHEKAHLGRRYQWMRTGPVPVMTLELADWLKARTQTTEWNGVDLEVSEATLDSIAAFREQCTQATSPELLEEHLDWMRLQANLKTLHGAWLPGLIDLMEYALVGLVSAADAIDEAGDAFVELRTDATRAAYGGNVRDEEAATKEFIDLLKWAVGKVQAKFAADPAALQYSALLSAGTYYGTPMPNYTPPATFVPEEMPARGRRAWYHPKESEADDGRILVRNTHVDISNALAPAFCATHRWVQNGGGGDGEWWVYDPKLMVWSGGGQKTSVIAYIIRALRDDFAAYDIVDSSKAGRSGAIPADVDALTSMYGPTMHLYKLTDRPGTHAPELGHIADMLKAAAGVVSRREEFDATGARIAVANGMLDVRTHEFVEATPGDLVTKRMPIQYQAGADCPRFLSFLQSAVQVGTGPAAEAHAQQVMGLIQRYFGAAILDDWSTDSFLAVHGPGGSGKSTIFEDVPRHLFGEGSGYWSMVTPAVFTRGISEAGRKFELATVAGARLLTCNEAFEGTSHLDVSFLKGFTDGSVQRAAFKGRDNFSMTPGRVVFMSNNLPKLTSVDSGVARRACFIEFPHGHSKSDPTLPDPDEKLFERDIVPELPGILNWVIEGAAAYLTAGLNPPTTVYASTKSALLDSSEIGTFLQFFRPWNEDDPEALKSEFLTLKDLHNLYRDWLEMTSPRGASATNLMPEREMLASIKAAFPLTDSPEKRVNVYLDNGTRAKARAVYGITANEAMGAFLAVRSGAAPTVTWMGMTVTSSVPRTRVGIPDVEEWRAKQIAPSGSALTGESAA